MRSFFRNDLQYKKSNIKFLKARLVKKSRIVRLNVIVLSKWNKGKKKKRRVRKCQFLILPRKSKEINRQVKMIRFLSKIHNQDWLQEKNKDIVKVNIKIIYLRTEKVIQLFLTQKIVVPRNIQWRHHKMEILRKVKSNLPIL